MDEIVASRRPEAYGWRVPVLAGLAVVAGTHRGPAELMGQSSSKPLGFVLDDHGKIFAYQRLSQKHAELSRLAGDRLQKPILGAIDAAKDFFGEGRPGDSSLQSPYDASPTADYGLVHPISPEEYDQIQRWISENTDKTGRVMYPPESIEDMIPMK